MVTIVSESGIKDRLEPITGTYEAPDHSLLLEGCLWDFHQREDGTVHSRVSLAVYNPTRQVRYIGIATARNFPFFRQVQKQRPAHVLHIESHDDVDNTYGYDTFLVIDSQGKSLATQEPSDKTLWNSGYLHYIIDHARERHDTILDRDVLLKVFKPIEDRVRAHFTQR